MQRRGTFGIIARLAAIVGVILFVVVIEPRIVYAAATAGYGGTTFLERAVGMRYSIFTDWVMIVQFHLLAFAAIVISVGLIILGYYLVGLVKDGIRWVFFKE